MVYVAEVLSEISRHLKARAHHFALMETLSNDKHIVESTPFAMSMTIELFAIFFGTPWQ